MIAGELRWTDAATGYEGGRYFGQFVYVPGPGSFVNHPAWGWVRVTQVVCDGVAVHITVERSEPPPQAF